MTSLSVGPTLLVMGKFWPTSRLFLTTSSRSSPPVCGCRLRPSFEKPIKSDAAHKQVLMEQ